MHYLQITIPAADPSTQEILIAQLSALGYEGFEQQDATLQAFLPEDLFDSTSLDTLLAPWQLTATRERLEERNWNQEWEKNFEPVVIDDFCAIRAHFHDPVPGVRHDLLITPKMSFGTGHHATTWLMIRAMEQLDFRGRRVLDFGTGTGVLAILAERLGAGEVIAVDYDEWSITNARENLDKNHCTRITLVQTDTIPPAIPVPDPATPAPPSDPEPLSPSDPERPSALGARPTSARPTSVRPTSVRPTSADSPFSAPFDIILANINKHVILQQLSVIGQHLKEEGVILLSGLLQEDESDIRQAAAKNDLPISLVMTKGGWICGRAEKKTK